MSTGLRGDLGECIMDSLIDDFHFMYSVTKEQIIYIHKLINLLN